MNEQELENKIESLNDDALETHQEFKDDISDLIDEYNKKRICQLIELGELSERSRINEIIDGVIRGHSKEKCPICCTALCRAYLVFDLRSEVNK